MSRTTKILLLIACLAGLAAGKDAWAKFFWLSGAPQLAYPLLSDPAAQAAALYEMGRYKEADEGFTRVGRSATYDRALSLAMTGKYELSVAYFDAVLFSNEYDRDARLNQEIVSSLVVPVIGESSGHGRIEVTLRAAGLNVVAFDPNNPSQAIEAQGPTDGVRRLERGIDNRTVSAGEDWLETLADSPGAYLGGRLAAEMERRVTAGEAHKAEPSKW
ncbi:hypothetical protein [Roseibium algae]|uniref:Ca-activated chloride channel family protein n=1 Tax=Roseibium algae TaxID=3123038 RepID=A0ABU8TMH3_9HYPH